MQTGKSLDTEGMMFVGDKGKIIAGFRGENPVLIPEDKKLVTQPKIHRKSQDKTATMSGSTPLKIIPSHQEALFMQDL